MRSLKANQVHKYQTEVDNAFWNIVRIETYNRKLRREIRKQEKMNIAEKLRLRRECNEESSSGEEDTPSEEGTSLDSSESGTTSSSVDEMAVKQNLIECDDRVDNKADPNSGNIEITESPLSTVKNSEEGSEEAGVIPDVETEERDRLPNANWDNGYKGDGECVFIGDCKTTETTDEIRSNSFAIENSIGFLEQEMKKRLSKSMPSSLVEVALIGEGGPIKVVKERIVHQKPLIADRYLMDLQYATELNNVVFLLIKKDLVPLITNRAKEYEYQLVSPNEATTIEETHHRIKRLKKKMYQGDPLVAMWSIEELLKNPSINDREKLAQLWLDNQQQMRNRVCSSSLPVVQKSRHNGGIK